MESLRDLFFITQPPKPDSFLVNGIWWIVNSVRFLVVESGKRRMGFFVLGLCRPGWVQDLAQMKLSIFAGRVWEFVKKDG